MTGGGARTTTLGASLDRVRLRLTAWYVGTFFAILFLLGVGLFATITKRFDRELDLSLREATHELVRVATVRDRAATASATRFIPFDSIRDLTIPGRTLYVLDTTGHSTSGEPVDPWIADLARAGWIHRGADRAFNAPHDRILRGHAEPIVLPSGPGLVAVAVADEIELEDRYTSLIVVFGVTSLAALVLVAVGGWFLTQQSTAPVEAAIAHMRRFMADAAHELRTPLTIVRSRAEVALQRPRDADEYVRALRGIEQDSTRLGRIVEDLLMLARADAGERPIEHHRVFLDDIALDAAEAARVIADRKLVSLEVVDFEEAAVSGDAELLRQAVMILLDNAIKFTGAGGVVRVAVTARGSSVSLVVSDTGIGIPAEQLPHVFDRFYRGDPSRRRESTSESGMSEGNGMSEGAGLGLSIARWIVEEHDGSISIESAPGQGTRAIVQFPAASIDVVSSS
ncbi:MAG: HAMP domain-containing sensor histidine kinase [Gemmatimonadaceae bacterium]